MLTSDTATFMNLYRFQSVSSAPQILLGDDLFVQSKEASSKRQQPKGDAYDIEISDDDTAASMLDDERRGGLMFPEEEPSSGNFADLIKGE